MRYADSSIKNVSLFVVELNRNSSARDIDSQLQGDENYRETRERYAISR